MMVACTAEGQCKQAAAFFGGREAAGEDRV